MGTERKRPVILVAGLGRCGSSLMMQMLHSAGVPCIGTAPAFEVEEANHRPIDPAWLSGRPGHALKLLDPHVTRLPAGVPAVVIWLDRKLIEQARSQVKFMAAFGRGRMPSPRTWAVRLVADRKASLAALRGLPLLRIPFEGLIEKPVAMANRLDWFLRPHGFDLDPQKLAAPVLPRKSRCAPDLRIELAAMEARKVA